MSQHELILVLDARVDEITEQPALDTIIWLGRIIDWPVWQATADQAVSIVAPAGVALARNGLAAWIDATHGRAPRAPQAPRIARPIRIHIFEIIGLISRQSSLRAIPIPPHIAR